MRSWARRAIEPVDPVYGFTFAVQATPARHAEEWARLARDARDLGYHALLVPDHQGSGGPISAMAVAGAAAPEIHLGPLVMAVDFQHPVVLAQEFMTLDALLGGRLEIGLGAGWMRRDYERTGVAMAGPGTRIDRLREFVALFQQLWSGSPVHHTGRHYQCRGAIGAPRPHSPRPTLVLGGGGRRMLTLAAEVADIVNLGAPMTGASKDAPLGHAAAEESFLLRRQWIEHAGAHRTTPPRLQCLVYETHVNIDALIYAANQLSDSFALPAEDIVRSPLTLLGAVDEICCKIEWHRERLGISYWVVKSPAMHDFAPVVARLAGK